MILIDTSVVIQLLRDKRGRAGKNWRSLVARRDYCFSRFTQVEVLHGAKTDDEWDLLESYLEGQVYVEASGECFRDAARLFFDLRLGGITPRNVTDCMIAQLAIEMKYTLVHNDRDFEAISRFRPALKQKRVDLSA